MGTFQGAKGGTARTSTGQTAVVWYCSEFVYYTQVKAAPQIALRVTRGVKQ
jgi:hypothetical protein